MNWACDAYNRTATVTDPDKCSPHKIFYGETPQPSPIPSLKRGFCKFKDTNKIDPKVRGCFCLGPARNTLIREGKRVLVRTVKRWS